MIAAAGGLPYGRLACADEPTVQDRHVVVSLRPEASRPADIRGRVIVEDQEGGLLIEDEAGTYWTCESSNIVAIQPAPNPFRRSNAAELAAALKQVAGDDAVVVTTRNYVIASRASRAYAAWCGGLLERLRTAFIGHWMKQQVELNPGDAPLPILILQNRAQFQEYAVRDGAAAAAETDGYYSARTNRVVLFDLTADGPGRALGNAVQREEITRRLSQSPGSVATVVHEAVHQLAFNTGLQVRYADNPMWFSEGLAMYFETPDFGVGSRWTTAGKVNPWRLDAFQKSLGSRGDDSLPSLIRNEDRFREPGQMTAAYAESWLLVHYLSTSRPAEWKTYVALLRGKSPLIFATPDERLQEFQSVFGDDLPGLDRALILHTSSLRPPRVRP